MEHGMSLADLAQGLGPYRSQISTGLVALPIGGALLGNVLCKLQDRAGAWFLSAVVHLAVFMIVPPLFVLGYLALGTHTNLFTQVDALLYFGPIASGMLTLFLVPQVLPLDRIPGFDRLRGLAGLTAITCVLLWGMSRMRLWGHIYILGSMQGVLLTILAVYLLVRYLVGKVMSPGRTPDLDYLPE